MDRNALLSRFSREELIDLIDIYCKDTLALDGVWFQSVEQKCGMDEAMYHDVEAWRRFSAIEARRLKAFLKLDEHPGLNGLEQALRLRFSSNIHKDAVERDENSLTYAILDCRVQCARSRKGMDFHPCKIAGLAEYAGFARAIDDHICCECVSCYPDVTDESCSCKWKFILDE